MKKLFIVLLACLFTSCEKKEDIDYHSINNPIELDMSTIEVPMSGGNYVINVLNYSECFFASVLEQIGEETEIVYDGSSKITNKLSKEWYILEIPSEKQNQLKCIINPNETGKNRSLVIEITAGDVFSKININQK